ncbi:MAG: polysaccharide deacetylase family protein [Lentihominibacter sp.]
MRAGCFFKDKRKLSFAVVFIVLAAVFIISASSCSKREQYHDESGFAAFADNEFKAHELVRPAGQQNISYYYGKGFSFAVRTEECPGEAAKAFIDDKVMNITEVSAKNSRYAVLVDTAVRRTDNGALSIMIARCEYDKDKHGRALFAGQQVDTFLINEEGTVLQPLQVLNVNYRSKASEFALEYIKKTYGASDRTMGWRLFLSPDSGNFNKFLMDGNSIDFFFDDNTVLKEGMGILTINIGPIPMETAIRPRVLERYVDRSLPMVAVTYDDGPGGESEAAILDTLKKNGSVATFFYQGYRLDMEPENARRAAEEGNEIGNHSWNHPLYSSLSSKEVSKQIKKTNSKIKEICGVEPVVSRPPYGDYDKDVLKAAGMAQILWTVDTLDWKTRNPKKIFKAVKSAGNLDGKIILMHSIHKETAKATEYIIPWLRQQGYQTVTVSELIKYKTGDAPEPGAVYRKLP